MLYDLGPLRPRTPDDGRWWAAPTAALIGRVELRTDASVWWGAVLRGDNEPIVVGERSNVQENAVLHTDMGFPLILGAEVTVGHQAMLHGCTVGDGSLIGIGAVVLNGAVIGRECLIGAKALVPEGRAIPDGSLVLGAPGRVVRELAAEERQRLRAGALHYVETWRRYARELRPTA
jgi:carbonic anhydrase/acetyltransferase-like protein (isoleucine patch superfamily)